MLKNCLLKATEFSLCSGLPPSNEQSFFPSCPESHVANGYHKMSEILVVRKDSSKSFEVAMCAECKVFLTDRSIIIEHPGGQPKLPS